MRILKLHFPTGHAYWNVDEYKIELPDGTFYDVAQHKTSFGDAHRIVVKDDGIYYQICYASSGSGKVDATDRFPAFRIVPKESYDKIEFVGSQLAMPKTLQEDLQAAGISYSAG